MGGRSTSQTERDRGQRAMIDVDHLSKEFQTDNGSVRALADVDFGVSDGEFLSIIGPSGCGKSTLVRIIGGLVEATEGSVTVNGQAPGEARAKGLFSFVFQNPVLLPWRRVIDNVRLPLEILRRESRSPSDLLQLVGLGGYEERHSYELSGGMQQRVALARALTFDPDVLLLDEPFGALDELTRHSMNELLLRIWDEIDATLLFITHSIPEAIYLADRVLVLSSVPARVRAIHDVPFPRPRTQTLKESGEFQEMVRCLRDELD